MEPRTVDLSAMEVHPGWTHVLIRVGVHYIGRMMPTPRYSVLMAARKLAAIKREALRGPEAPPSFDYWYNGREVRCTECGEESGAKGSSMYGSVHKYGPTTHHFSAV